MLGVTTSGPQTLKIQGVTREGCLAHGDPSSSARYEDAAIVLPVPAPAEGRLGIPVLPDRTRASLIPSAD